ncbi:uncharacterized protein LOC142627793 [Castanea sativa]|uniref:uncharacterized protein LOC142627793 n=1 Tax=Castanea sativa TaxID=21020 RepID=UPI003F64C9CA
MSLEIGIKVRKDSIPVCAENVESDCRCFSNNDIHDGWAQGRPCSADSGGTKRRALLHVDRKRRRNKWGRLYRRLYDGIHLLCVTAKEAQQVNEEVHESSNGPHMNAHMLSRKGIEIIGKIYPTTSNVHEFILVAIDYFTKWVEGALYKVLNSKKVAQFIQINIIYKYGTNGIVKAANKNIGQILKKIMKNYKDWHLQLPYALWGYKTLIRSSIGATPFSLVYGIEVVLPIKMGVRSFRTVLESEILEVDWLQSRYDQLCMMDEKRLKALYHIQGYQRRLRKAFGKKVRARDLKIGDLMLKEIQTSIQETIGEFKQNWVGSYIIIQIYFKGAVRLMNLDANPFTEPTNMDQLKKYHV